jgi:hypothetical protein
MKMEVHIERLPFETPFAISGYVFDSADVIVVSVWTCNASVPVQRVRC